MSNLKFNQLFVYIGQCWHIIWTVTCLCENMMNIILMTWPFPLHKDYEWVQVVWECLVLKVSQTIRLNTLTSWENWNGQSLVIRETRCSLTSSSLERDFKWVCWQVLLRAKMVLDTKTLGLNLFNTRLASFVIVWFPGCFLCTFRVST